VSVRASSGAPEREAQVHLQTYARQPLTLVSGHGCWVTDDAGREYLDLVAGIAVDVLGHAHPAVAEAVARQAATLVHVSNLYYSLPQLELAEALVARSPFDRVFFTNSGTEANEAALKLARRDGGERGAPNQDEEDLLVRPPRTRRRLILKFDVPPTVVIVHWSDRRGTQTNRQNAPNTVEQYRLRRTGGFRLRLRRCQPSIGSTR